jgi:hypothetical protein
LNFFDLAMLLFRKNAYEAGRKIGKSYKVFDNEDFGVISDPSFKFNLFASFSTEGSCPYVKLLTGADKIAKDVSANNFELFLRYGEENPALWNEETLRDNVPNDAVKIFVVGSFKFNEEMTTALKKIGFSDDIIKSI